MKINFDWHSYMSKNDRTKNTYTADGSLNSKKNIRDHSGIYNQTLVDISGKVTDDFPYSEQGMGR